MDVGERRKTRVLQTTSVMLGMIAGISITCCCIDTVCYRVDAYLKGILCA